MSKHELCFVHVEASQFLEDPQTEWLGVLGVRDAVEIVSKQVPEADMIVLTFNDFTTDPNS